MLDLLAPGKSISPPGPINWMPPPPQAEEEEEVLYPEDLNGSAYFTPNIVLMYGIRGKGKSLGTTALGLFMLKAYRHKKLNVQVLANYNVTFAAYRTPFLVDELNGFPNWARNKLVLLDEIVEYMPSARSMARSSLDFASFIRQIRKRDIDIVMNTQFPTEVDRRMLRQVDLFIEVELHRRRGGKADLKMYIYDYWGNWTGDWSLSKKPWPPSHEDATAVKWFQNVHTVFRLYNNREVQAPIWSENREQILQEEGWVIQEPEAAPEEQVDHGVANNLAEYLVGQIRSDGALNIGLSFDGARVFMPEWKSRAGMIAYLKGQGWELQRVGTGANNMIAFPPQAFTP